ncbi:ring-cleaving dioxygenase [Bradyrhizobium mercantei]|uniref:ring-cleaving dioxygenase n=1 Tax=Bradyrhizobium mercantei TaxID=1904807 RepID=UPI0009776A24|nr:ring-cleaving dioxygenase [Bradyrhizobium mercantei]
MSGIHHITAIAGDPARNLDFYTRDVGLRLVKKTVNFDDPSTYHFYYGDAAGSPGTILTFFLWPGSAPGSRGGGEVHRTAFRVPMRSMDYWARRFAEREISCQAMETRFGEPVLPFSDPDGTALMLVGIAGAESGPAWSNGDVPVEHAIRGLHGATLVLDSAERTAAILTDVLGFREVGRDGALIRFAASGETNGCVVDIEERKGVTRGHQGRGSVHHIAFRATSDAEQAKMVEKLIAEHKRHPTEQKDRNYFRSIYFREPGGVLFEIATDKPGFAVDEATDVLGRDLRLPGFLESRRAEIESALPVLKT